MSSQIERFPYYLFLKPEFVSETKDFMKNGGSIAMLLGLTPTPEGELSEASAQLRAATLAAQEEMKNVFDSILKSAETVVRGKTVKPMKGINFHNLRTWNEMINNGEADFTRHIVWAYKIVWELLYALHDKSGDDVKNVDRLNNLKDWEKLHDADFFISDGTGVQDLANKLFAGNAKFGLTTFSPATEAKDRYNFKFERYFFKDNNEVSTARPENIYVLSPVARYPTDARKNTPDYNFTATPAWLDKFALQYVTTNYFVPYNNKSRMPTVQHAYGTANAYRAKIASKNRDKNLENQRSVYVKASNIQQLTEHPAAWRNVIKAYDDNGRYYTLFKDDSEFSFPVLQSNSILPFTDGPDTVFNGNEGAISLSKIAFDDYNQTGMGTVTNEYDLNNIILAFLVGGHDYDDLDDQPGDMFDKFDEALQQTWNDLKMGTDDGLKTGVTWNYTDSESGKKAAELGLHVPSANEDSKKLRATLLNPVYKVQIDSPMMLLAIKLVLHFTDLHFKGVIPLTTPDGRTLSLFDGVSGNASKKQKDQKDALKALITLCWSIMNGFETADKKVRQVESANSSIEETSDRVVKGEARKRQIQKNMQCFMLNLVDVFQSFQKKFPYNFCQIQGDSSNIFNLIGYKPQTIDKMLKIKPEQLAKMQPRIKLFKERKVYQKNSNVLQSYDLVEIKGPFATHTNTKSIQDALAQGGGRSLGGGIQEVEIIEEHGDADFDTPSTIKVEIKFIFNTLQEIFLNFPNIDENGKITFPYGRQPKDVGKSPKDVPASFAELVFPLTRNLKNEDYLNLINTYRDEFNVVVELGWSPPDNLKNLTPFEKQFFKDLNEQSLYKSYLLTPHDTEFNFTNEGQVELTARYFGLERSMQKSIGNRLFPRAGQASGEPLTSDPFVKGDLNEVKRLNKLKRKNPLSARQEADLQKAKHRLDDAVNSRSMFEFENFIRKQLNEMLKNLFEKKEIYVLRIPRAFLGARSDNNILKWSPTQDIEALRLFPRNVSQASSSGMADDISQRVNKRLQTAARNQFEENKENTENAPTKKGLKFNGFIGNVFAANKAMFEATSAARAKKATETQKRETGNAEKASKEIHKAATEALNAHNGGWEIEDNSYPIYWIYFADLVQGILDFSENEYKKLINQLNGVISIKDAAGVMRKVHLIMGTVKIPIIKGGKYIVHNINISEIPIVTSFVTKYIVDNLISPSAYYITKIEFITGLFKAVIEEYFNLECFVGSLEVNKTGVERTFFEVPSYRKNDFLGQGGLWNLGYSGPIFTRQGFKNEMKKLEDYLNGGSIDITKNPRYKYCFLGTRAFTEGSYSYKKDLEENIHHFYFGANEGLVKSVNFVSEDLQHQTEALIFEGASGLELQADAFVPRIFNCEVTMIGNTLFNPGHTFYFDPTMGTVLGQAGDVGNKRGINIIKNTGLGGYFYVARVQHRLSPGSFETTLEGIKTGITKKKDATQQPGFDRETNLEQPKIPDKSKSVGKMGVGDLLGAAMSKIGDEIGL